MSHPDPENYPVYQATRRIRLPGGPDSVTVGLKSTGLDVHFRDGEILHYDLAGRLLRGARPNVQWRRGLSGRMIELRRRSRAAGGGLARRLLDSAEADQRIEEASARLQPLGMSSRGEGEWRPANQLDTGDPLAALLRTAAGFDTAAARQDVARFRAVYHDIPILPPDQYTSLVLAATEGCRYNRCTFCSFYRDTAYRAKTLDEFHAHVRAALAFHGRGLTLRRSVFLGQATALLGPRSWREDILRSVQRVCEFPSPDQRGCAPDWWQGSVTRFAGITSFLDAFVGARMRPDEFAALRALHLRQVFIGMETGSDGLLRWLRKPATAEQVVETVRAAKAGGVQVGVMVLVGAGGERYFDEHVASTVSVLRAMALEPGDYIYLSPLVAAPESEYATLAAADNVQPLTPLRLAQQEQQMRTGLRTSPARHGPYVARYDVANFVY